MICKDTIKKRKVIYGNNFPKIANLQNKFNNEMFYKSIKNKNFIIRFILTFLYKIFNKNLTPKDIAMNLAILKQVRIDFIKAKLQEFRNDANFDTFIVQNQIKELNIALEDSKKDYHNYIWIANNYKEYEEL